MTDVDEEPMLAHLSDLEASYETETDRPYEPRDLIRYALGGTDYWADRALRWLEQGAPVDGLDDALLGLASQAGRPQNTAASRTSTLEEAVKASVLPADMLMAPPSW